MAGVGLETLALAVVPQLQRVVQRGRQDVFPCGQTWASNNISSNSHPVLWRPPPPLLTASVLPILVAAAKSLRLQIILKKSFI